MVYIKEIHINEFRHLKNIHLGPFPQPTDESDLVVLAGPNGSGKSSILEIIGYALSNHWSLGYALRRTLSAFSFEVSIAISKDERRLIEKYAQEQRNSSEDILKYLEENGAYYRSYNYAGSEYLKNQNLYNRIHNIVTGALRDYDKRSLGFFLKSDRYYPSKGFDRNRIFDYEGMTQINHIRNLAFSLSDTQYNDMFDFLVQQRYHYFQRLGIHYHKKSLGMTVDVEPPKDPLEVYDSLLQMLFPGYSFTNSGEVIPSNLFIRLPSGKDIPFGDLSGGEQEVFFILATFLRHNVNSAMIIIDEPELHLHPELARQLIRTMLTIKPNNQIWLATHNAEIIDEAGRDKVFYITRDPSTRQAVVIPGTDESQAIKGLKDMFGYSGFIGVAKTMVFLEGIDSSSDRKMFSRLFPKYATKMKFVPSKSTSELTRINTTVLSILADKLGWMHFYLIRDRDYLTPEVIAKFKKDTSGHMYVLNRYHIENYLLDEELISKVQEEVFGKPILKSEVGAKLNGIALKMSAEVLRDMISYRLNLVYSPQDFSLGKYMENDQVVDTNGNRVQEKIEMFKAFLASRTSEVNNGLLSLTSPESLASITERAVREVEAAVGNGKQGWKILFPGRPILEDYAKQEGLGKSPAFINSLIKEMAATQEKIPEELVKTMKIIDEAGTFG